MLAQVNLHYVTGSRPLAELQPYFNLVQPNDFLEG
jgi:hypothetical protein